MTGPQLPQVLYDKQADLNRLCRSYHVTYLAIFGSAVKGKFTESSDLDFLVSFETNLPAREKADAYFSLKEALEALFSRQVDLVSMASLDNPYFRESVMQDRQPLYAA